MLVIELSKIGLEGLDLDTPLIAGEVHIQGEEGFQLESGGLKAHVDIDDESTVHVQGHLSARLGVECGRCLDPVAIPVEQNVDLFFLPHREDVKADEEDEDEVELKESDLVVAYYRGNRLDLGEVVREQLFLSVPMKRLCQDACQGLCPSCGANRNRVRCACVVDATSLHPGVADATSPDEEGAQSRSALRPEIADAISPDGKSAKSLRALRKLLGK
jgi:uncharacterized metal-binding protein YceD (DUF177 family)